jgi:hypothetical protein
MRLDPISTVCVFRDLDLLIVDGIGCIGEVHHDCPNAKIMLIGFHGDLREHGNPNHVTEEERRRFDAAINSHASIPFHSIPFHSIPCSGSSGEGMNAMIPEVAKTCATKRMASAILLKSYSHQNAFPFWGLSRNVVNMF